MRDIFKQRRSFFPALLHEPLVHFLLIGAAVFIAAEFYHDWQQERAQEVVIDDGLRAYLANRYSAQFGGLPDEPTMEQLINNYVNEEVLYREAIRLGLNSDDEIIRRRLVQKMEYLLADTGVPANPETEVLESWYAVHQKEYFREATVSFQHLYFSGELDQRAAPKQRALAALEAIESETMQQAEELADPFPLQNHYSGLTSTQVQQLFGHAEFSSAIFKSPAGRWSGPVQSGYGWHVFLVEERIDPVLMDLTEVRDRVSSDWQNAMRQQQLQAALQEILEQYQVRYKDSAGTE